MYHLRVFFGHFFLDHFFTIATVVVITIFLLLRSFCNCVQSKCLFEKHSINIQREKAQNVKNIVFFSPHFRFAPSFRFQIAVTRGSPISPCHSFILRIFLYSCCWWHHIVQCFNRLQPAPHFSSSPSFPSSHIQISQHNSKRNNPYNITITKNRSELYILIGELI